MRTLGSFPLNYLGNPIRAAAATNWDASLMVIMRLLGGAPVTDY
jgi:hypothetical protein